MLCRRVCAVLRQCSADAVDVGTIWSHQQKQHKCVCTVLELAAMLLDVWL